MNYCSRLESRYDVLYPREKVATYLSMVNYTSDLNTPIQRWYRYKEGYSFKLVKHVFDDFNVKPGDVILDPFCGSGTTLLYSKNNNIKSYGFEVNPFTFLLSIVKTRNYSNKEIKEIIRLNDCLKNKTNISPAKKPKLSFIDKLFNKDVLIELLRYKSRILAITDEKIRSLFFIAWLSVLEELSNYRKAGNGLKKRTAKKRHVTTRDVSALLFKKIEEITRDIKFAHNNGLEPKIYRMSAKHLDEKIDSNMLRGALFSPPYANCFDYTEIYKIELWLGNFVRDYDDLRLLRKETLRSHLSHSGLREYFNKDNTEVEEIVNLISKRQLWDKRIPDMIRGYFTDMRIVLQKIYNSLVRKGFCVIVVSNSAYGGLVIPTDLLLARIGEKLNFKVLKIEVARYIITSSQQYEKTKKYRKYLRESIVYLQKG